MPSGRFVSWFIMSHKYLDRLFAWQEFVMCEFVVHCIWFRTFEITRCIIMARLAFCGIELSYIMYLQDCKALHWFVVESLFLLLSERRRTFHVECGGLFVICHRGSHDMLGIWWAYQDGRNDSVGCFFHSPFNVVEKE